MMNWPNFKVAVIAGNANQYRLWIKDNFLNPLNFPLMTNKTQFIGQVLHGCIKIGTWYEREDARALEKCAINGIEKAAEIAGMKNIFN